MKAPCLVAVFSIVLFLWCSATRAADVYWQYAQPTTGDWFNSANWTTGVPTAADTAYIGGGGQDDITAGTASAATVYLGQTLASGAGTLMMSGGQLSTDVLNIGTLAAGQLLYDGGQLDAGTVNVGAQGLLDASDKNAALDVWTFAGQLNVAGGTVDMGKHDLAFGDETAGAGGTSAATISSGSLTAESMTVGLNTASTFTQTGGTVTVNGRLFLGEPASSDASGTYELAGGYLGVSGGILTGYAWPYSNSTIVIDGGSLNADSVDVAKFEYDSGSVSVASTVTASDVVLAEHPTDNVTLSGVQFSAREVVIGGAGQAELISSAGSNDLQAEGAGSALDPGQLILGRDAGSVGVWDHNGGLTDLAGNVYLGYNAGATGKLYFNAGQAMGDWDACQGIYVGYAGTGQFVQTGGSFDANLNFVVGSQAGSSGSFISSGGQFQTASLIVGQAGHGEWHLTSPDAQVTITHSLIFGPDSVFTAEPGTTVRFGGFVDNWGDPLVDPRVGMRIDSTHSSDLAGLANVNWICTGGPIEVAGKDVGATSAGWVDNFVLGTLTVAGGLDTGGLSDVSLVNDSVNQPGWDGAEALYVKNLVIQAGGVIHTDGLNLYYLNGGAPKKFLEGDANLDGVVNGSDFVTLAVHYTGSAGSGADWAEGDFNGDGVVDGKDFVILATSYGAASLPTSSVPEPASLALLALGSLILAGRKRRPGPALAQRRCG